MRLSRLLFIAVLVACAAVWLRQPKADYIVLTDGTKIHGQVYEKNGRVGIIIPRDRIKSVHRDAPSQTAAPSITQAPAAAATSAFAPCDRCDGMGYTEDACPTCQMSGKITCTRCRGEGFDYKNCKICGGRGIRWDNLVSRNVSCGCRSNGDPRQNSLVRCENCHGIGTLTCPNCKGTGKLKADCPHCTGGRKTTR